MLNHTEISWIVEICAVTCFFNRKILSLTVFFVKMILPATRLSTIAVVRISACHIAWNKASAWKWNAHCTVYKAFDFKLFRNFCTHFGNFIKRNFSCKHNPWRTHIVKHICRRIVCYSRLSRNVTLNLWRILFSRLKNTEVGNYERINSASLSILHKFLKMRNFIIAWKCVAGHMDSCTLCVGKVTSFFELIVIKILRCGTHSEHFPCKKNCICAKV